MMKRRDFIPSVGLAGFLPASGGAAGRGKPKIGCVSWNFHSLAPGANPEKAIDIIGSLGFDGVELIANSRADVKEYWTDATISRVKKQLERKNLVLPQFPMQRPVARLQLREPRLRELLRW